MKFVLQTNLINDDHCLQIKYAIEKYPHIFAENIPFSNEITSRDNIRDTNFIPYGSTNFTTLTHELGWKGCFFNLRNFTYGAFLENRDDMLNDNVIWASEAIEFLDKQDPDSDWFIRPSSDLKQFVGQVNTAKNLSDWLKRILGGNSSDASGVSEHTFIVVSTPKNIQAEWRWFVVGGKVVSGSMYRYRGHLHKARVIEQDMIDEAQRFADKWLPHETVCMDLALVDDEVKVIEFNCINSSGFYDNCVETVFDAIWEKHGQ